MDYQESAHAFEPKWRQYWVEQDVFRTPNPGDADFDASRPKKVILDFFPYPSGIGLHIGHPLGYIATDVLARYHRMTGHNVLHAMGFDSFGLPAEQFAIQTGQHPRVTTEANIATMSGQLALLGLGHDPHRSFSTTDPEYYRWTQWLFLLLFESYYDPAVQWTAANGQQITGRARPIQELPDRLRSGEWVVTRKGEAVPASQVSDGRRVTDEDELRDVVNSARLAYLADMPVNWCPDLGTVLSNEEVTNDGRSERGNYPVYRRDLRQWVLRITKYAPRLLDDMEGLDWPTGIKQMQRDWIGSSEGLELDFAVTGTDGQERPIRVFTTRPDTLFGATFLVISPQHPLVDAITTADHLDDVNAYRNASAVIGRVTREDRDDDAKDGMFTGAYATHPATGAPVPVWIADYVLMDYGTGAVMGVPAHDERDMAFARTQDLPIVAVIRPPAPWIASAGGDGSDAELVAAYVKDPARFGAFSGQGLAINSSCAGITLDGLPTAEAKATISDWIEARGGGVRRVQYRLRDWLFSRQRYWGEPFPVVTDLSTGRIVAIHDDELPLTLPEMADFQPTTGLPPDSDPVPPLGRVGAWMEVDGWLDGDRARTVEGSGPPPAGTPVVRLRRDANTMPNWAGSCWYYLRYFDAHNQEAFAGQQAEQYWATGGHPQAPGAGSGARGAVDLYVGGAEHAVLHLLYARFWHKVMFDRGLVSTAEPFQRLFNQGMITADAFHDDRGVYVDYQDVVVKQEGSERRAYRISNDEPLQIQTGKMGKRYKNGIPPEEVGQQYTMDTLRVYEMFLGPLDMSKPWQPNDIVGSFRFLRNVWRICVDRDRLPLSDDVPAETERLRHRTIKRVTEELADLRMNKAIALLMEWTNALQKQPAVSSQQLGTLAMLVSPFAPHLGEELASRIFGEAFTTAGSVLGLPWPQFEESLARDEVLKVPVQVNSKTRAVIEVEPGLDEEALVSQASAAVAKQLDGMEIIRTIVKRDPVPRIISFVVKPVAG
jgi:leucyl-tRNA synthetase